MGNCIRIFLIIVFTLFCNQSSAGAYIGVEFENSIIDGRKFVVITKVFKNSPASRAGLMPTDVILKFNDDELIDILDFAYRIQAIAEAIPIRMEILRNSEKKIIVVNVVFVNEMTINLRMSCVDFANCFQTEEFDIYVNDTPLGKLKPRNTTEIKVNKVSSNFYKIYLVFTEHKILAMIRLCNPILL